MVIVLVLILVFFLCVSKSKIPHQFAILALCLLFSNRNDLIPDTINYSEIYLSNIKSDDNIEIGFLYLCYFFQTLGFSFNQFLFIVLLICLECVYHYSCQIMNRRTVGIALILLMSYFGIYYYGIVIRSAIAISMCYCGIVNALCKNTNSSRLLLFTIILIASFIHISSILFILVFLLFNKIPKYILNIVIGFTIFFLVSTSVLPISGFIEVSSRFLNAPRLIHYAYLLNISDGASILSWTYIIISVLALRYRKEIPFGFEQRTFECFLNLYIIGSFINSLLWQIPGGDRVSMQLLFFEFVIIYYLVFKTKMIVNINNKLMFIGIFVFTKSFALFHYIPLLLNY